MFVSLILPLMLLAFACMPFAVAVAQINHWKVDISMLYVSSIILNMRAMLLYANSQTTLGMGLNGILSIYGLIIMGFIVGVVSHFGILERVASRSEDREPDWGEESRELERQEHEQELRAMSIADLKTFAGERGVHQELLLNADDSVDVKGTIIGLVLDRDQRRDPALEFWRSVKRLSIAFLLILPLIVLFVSMIFGGVLSLVEGWPYSSGLFYALEAFCFMSNMPDGDRAPLTLFGALLAIVMAVWSMTFQAAAIGLFRHFEITLEIRDYIEGDHLEEEHQIDIALREMAAKEEAKFNSRFHDDGSHHLHPHEIQVTLPPKILDEEDMSLDDLSLDDLDDVSPVDTPTSSRQQGVVKSI